MKLAHKTETSVMTESVELEPMAVGLGTGD